MPTETKEILTWSESWKEVVWEAKKSLSILEKETRINFFKDASDWIKTLFWFKKSNDTESNTTSTSSKIDTSKVDTNWFTPWAYPFKHITTPYKWISSYRVDNIKLNPLIWFSQLSLKWTEWNLTTLKVKDQKLHFTSTTTAWYKKNNPCNVSPFKGDIGRNWSSAVADGQNHSKYNSMEDWLASFMRLMRQDRYRNKSIQWINCSWMQGVYKENEPDSLKALRITWITHACESLHVRLETATARCRVYFRKRFSIVCWLRPWKATMLWLVS